MAWLERQKKSVQGMQSKLQWKKGNFLFVGLSRILRENGGDYCRLNFPTDLERELESLLEPILDSLSEENELELEAEAEEESEEWKPHETKSADRKKRKSEDEGEIQGPVKRRKATPSKKSKVVLCPSAQKLENFG